MKKLLAAALCSFSLAAQTISIEEFEPKSTLVVPQHKLTRARFPFIDVHNHQRAVGNEKLGSLIRDMDGLNMRILVDSLPMGASGEWVKNAVKSMKAHSPSRFAAMTSLDLKDIGDPNYSQRAAAQLEEDIKNGAVGLKVWKNF